MRKGGKAAPSHDFIYKEHGRSYAVVHATILDDSAGDLVAGHPVRVNEYDDNDMLPATKVTVIQQIHRVRPTMAVPFLFAPVLPRVARFQGSIVEKELYVSDGD